MQVTSRFSGHRLLLWLLCLLLLIISLTGCGNAAPEGSTSAGETAKGRFLEEELTLPEDITMVETIGRLSDGSLEMMALTGDGAERKLFSSKNNGGSWEEIALPKELDAAQDTLDASAQELAQNRAALEAGRETLASYRAQLSDASAQLDYGHRMLADGWMEIQDAQAQLERSREELESAKTEIADGEIEIADAKQEIADGWQEIADAEEELLEGRQEYEDGLAEYQDARAEFEQEIADAEAEIADAEAELNDLELPETYVLGRDTNVGYVCFENDSSIVDGIANIFPVFFFLVAALVCSTTMNRMVEEQITQIGVL